MTTKPIYIIAEMACAHDGDFEKAKKIIDAAVVAKADAVQLQFFVADHVVTPHHNVYDVLKKIEFNHQQWEALFQYGKDKDIDVWACTYDTSSLALAVKLGVDGIKINSSDLSHPAILKGVCQAGIPFTLGTGASTMEEIVRAVQLIEQNGALENVILMHGVQNFPTAIEDLNIARIKLLQNVFNLPVGYADHTDASNPFAQTVDLLAVSHNIVLLEKHITLDRAEKGIDYQAALEPLEWIDYVKRVRFAEKALGAPLLQPLTESDLNYRTFQKKSIVANKALAAGVEIKKEDIIFIRNAENGLSPSQVHKVIGKKVARALEKFDNITEADLSA
ncbi:MAG: N-acetylneuraminate synthase family protein [Thermonemataceae bacterium]